MVVKGLNLKIGITVVITVRELAWPTAMVRSCTMVVKGTVAVRGLSLDHCAVGVMRVKLAVDQPNISLISCLFHV